MKNIQVIWVLNAHAKMGFVLVYNLMLLPTYHHPDKPNTFSPSKYADFLTLF